MDGLAKQQVVAAGFAGFDGNGSHGFKEGNRRTTTLTVGAAVPLAMTHGALLTNTADLIYYGENINLLNNLLGGQ